ncbi:MAG: MarR family transcriptional regulator [Longimicrobiales bacterium]|nr:MarR family transcriptional regulator [Longimicrobiales bacterium]
MSRSDAGVAVSALLRVLETCRRREMPDPSRRAPVSGHQARVLLQLDDEDPTMVGELAEFLGVTPSTMSLNLKRLEERGYVDRRRDPDDRRVMNVRLTRRGAEVKRAWTPLDPTRVDAVLRSLRPEERSAALAGLCLLADAADRLTARGDAYLRALTGEGMKGVTDPDGS